MNTFCEELSVAGVKLRLIKRIVKHYFYPHEPIGVALTVYALYRYERFRIAEEVFLFGAHYYSKKMKMGVTVSEFKPALLKRWVEKYASKEIDPNCRDGSHILNIQGIILNGMRITKSTTPRLKT